MRPRVGRPQPGGEGPRVGWAKRSVPNETKGMFGTALACLSPTYGASPTTRLGRGPLTPTLSPAGGEGAITEAPQPA